MASNGGNVLPFVDTKQKFIDWWNTSPDGLAGWRPSYEDLYLVADCFAMCGSEIFSGPSINDCVQCYRLFIVPEGSDRETSIYCSRDCEIVGVREFEEHEASLK